jgi:hypothetical protein
MRKALALSIALGVGLGLGQVMAEDAQTQVPNLVGTWTSPVKLKWMRAKGTAEGSLTLRVLDQDGPLLKLEKSWETPGAAGNVGGKDVEKATVEGCHAETQRAKAGMWDLRAPLWPAPFHRIKISSCSSRSATGRSRPS